MNLTNEDALDVMVAIGRKALERGKVDQALTIFAGVLSRSPNHALAWFSLGRAHLLKGAPDHAALCYHRTAVLAKTQRGLPENLGRLATDNLVLCGEKVLPRDWLPALQDPHLASCWGAALSSLAGAAAAAAGEGRCPPLRALVVGGLGVQALQLHALLTAAATATAVTAATDAATATDVVGSPGGVDSVSRAAEAAAAVAAAAAGPGGKVVWVLPDELSKTLAAQMGAAAGVPRTQLAAVNGWQEAVEAVAARVAAPVDPPAEGAGEQQTAAAVPAPAVGLLVAARVCGAKLALTEWAGLLAQARPLLAPQPLLCPAAARMMGVLAASEDLIAMNQVELDWMLEDSGGLDYGPANELLWRPARSMQVSGLRYRLMSEPFLLLPEVTAVQLLERPDEVLGAAAADPTAPTHGTAAAMAAAAGARAAAVVGRARRHDVVVAASAEGRVDCVVCWMEYDLAPGVRLSYAPHEMQGRTDPPALSPHVWQRVQYLSARPMAQQGQLMALQVTLAGGGDDLRVEYDEDLHSVQMASVAAAAAALSPGGAGSDPGCCGGGGDLPPGEPLLPEGEELSGGGSSDSGGSSEDEGGGGGGGGGAGASGAGDDTAGPAGGAGTLSVDGAEGVAPAAAETAPAAAAAQQQSGLILPYHMSMLNDRVRTRCYAAGIRAAVAEAKARHSGQQPLVVLDVGAGTGLLSMMAARAGAQTVVGVERELALAVAAGALTAANQLNHAVSIVQTHSKNLRVAAGPTQQPPGQQPEAAAPAEAAATTPVSGAEAAVTASSAEGCSGGAAESTAPAVPPPPQQLQQQSPQQSPQQQRPDPDSAAQLPARAGLVVHEIFGTDPLSEHILPSMAQVQADLAAPDALYLPSAFRLVAAGAHSELLAARMRTVRPPLAWGSGTSSGNGSGSSSGTPPAQQQRQQQEAPESAAGPGEGSSGLNVEGGPGGRGGVVLGAAEAARLERVLPAAAATALQAWAPWKAELDLLRVPDLLLTTEPVVVSSLRLDTSPLPRAYRSYADAEPCAPTPLAHLFKRHGTQGEELPAPEAAAAAAIGGAGEAGATAAGVSTTCVVYWFEADCGAGGWLSTCPGSGSTYLGHWAQNVQFLEEPLPGLDPGLVAAGRLRVRLAAECMLDRVRLGAEWVQEGDPDGSSSSGSDEE